MSFTEININCFEGYAVLIILVLAALWIVFRVKNQKRINSVIESCEGETVRRWLRGNLDSAAFCQFTDISDFLRRHIDAEESKLRGGHIDLVFIAHGAIRGSMLPACCLLPRTTITDVLLYAPWNSLTDYKAAEGIASGRMKPRERVFYSSKEQGHSIPSEKHHPKDLPDHWNSMKQAGEQKIPNIILSPLKPSEAPKWKEFTQPARNRIVIPYIQPASTESVPFFVVTLALSLLLRSSRFQATVHLICCLADQSRGEKFDPLYLKQQYAYTDDDTVMTWSPKPSLIERIKRWIGWA